MNITIDRLILLFEDTLQKCGVYLLDLSDEDIGYAIFEEVCIGIISFLHEDTLLKLKNENMINELIMQKCVELRMKFLTLENTDKWNISSVRDSLEWRNVLELSDEIKVLLEMHRSRFVPKPG
jgi:hypothetical protein